MKVAGGPLLRPTLPTHSPARPHWHSHWAAVYERPLFVAPGAAGVAAGAGGAGRDGSCEGLDRDGHPLLQPSDVLVLGDRHVRKRGEVGHLVYFQTERPVGPAIDT